MDCTNCAKTVDQQAYYYLGGFNKNIFCSWACVQNMYDGIYNEKEIRKIIVKKDNLKEY